MIQLRNACSLRKVPIDAIAPNHQQPRSPIDEDQALHELAKVRGAGFGSRAFVDQAQDLEVVLGGFQHVARELSGFIRDGAGGEPRS